MSAALLDVNVLVALFDSDHIHHDAAHDWFADHEADGWATCPLTENGFVRVLTNPGYGAAPLRATDLVARLRRFCSSRDHLFWPDAVSLRDETLFDAGYVQGHRQLTDVYLLGLTVKMKGRLATFDHGIPLSAVRGASRSRVVVIGSDPGSL